MTLSTNWAKTPAILAIEERGKTTAFEMAYSMPLLEEESTLSTYQRDMRLMERYLEN